MTSPGNTESTQCGSLSMAISRLLETMPYWDEATREIDNGVLLLIL